MKKSLILLPIFLIFAIVIFFILMSKAISKEKEKAITNKNSFVEERIDAIWTIEQGMMSASELLISIKDSGNYKIYGAQRWNQYVTPYLV